MTSVRVSSPGEDRDEVDPKVLVPCHGFNPERLLPNNGEQLLPVEGKTYILANRQASPWRR